MQRHRRWRQWFWGMAFATALMVACAGTRPPEPIAISPLAPPQAELLAGSPALPSSPATRASAASDCGSLTGDPTDNPLATFYGEAAPAWTNELRWECVYNLKDFAGQTDGERLQAAQQAAIAGGGGVVYLPAGTYTLTTDLRLADQVVLRGDIPEVTDAKNENFSPPTKLEFPAYVPRFEGNGTPNDTAFKQILPQHPDRDRNQGLVFLDVNRAAIAFKGDPDTGTMANRVIFGIRSNNVAAPDAGVPDESWQPGWARFSDRFAANIRLTVAANALVANNRLNDAITDAYDQPGYLLRAADQDTIVTYADGSKVPFSYTDHYGIVVNRSKPGGFQYARDPADEPGLFRPGIALWDNWVYKTMRVGIMASGQGLVMRGNQVLDAPQKQAWVDPTGQQQPRGHMTFENRAIDWSGHDVLIADNRYQVTRHQIMDSRYQSTDGEGLLAQECCGGTSVEQVTIRNNEGDAYIGIYKVPDIHDLTIIQNQVEAGNSNTPAIYVNADTNHAPHAMSAVTIAENQITGGILARASGGVTDVVIQNNRGSGQLEASCGITVEGNQGLAVEPCGGDRAAPPQRGPVA